MAVKHHKAYQCTFCQVLLLNERLAGKKLISVGREG